MWSVERRENLFEDHSMADRVKRGEATGQQLFDYYLGWLTNPSVTDHYGLSLGGPPYARDWGMRVAVEDLRRVVTEARRDSREVVLGGHSLGGSIATAYAAWDFGGSAGRRGSLRARADRRCQRTTFAHHGPGDRRVAGPPDAHRPGSRSAASHLRSPVSSTSWARRSRRWRRTHPRSCRVGRCSRLSSVLRWRSRTRRGTATRSTPRRRRRIWQPPRCTPAGSPRAEIRAAGTAPASSARSSESPTCSSVPACPAWTAPPGSTRGD